MDRNYQKNINNGVRLYEDKKFYDSIKFYKKALNYCISSEDHSRVNYYIGLSYFSMGEYKLAQDFYKKSLSYNPDSRDVKWDLCLSSLHNGDLSYGMSLYKYRYNRSYIDSVQVPRLSFSFIEDISEENFGSNILVIREQGIGDELLFSRIIPRLSLDFRSVKIQVLPELYNLFKNTFSSYVNIEFLSVEDGFSGLGSIDYYTLFGTLFSYYNRDSVISPVILNPLSDGLKGGLISKSDKIRVGFCLGGNPKSRNYSERSVLDSDFLEIIRGDFPGMEVELYNFQISRELSYGNSISEYIKDMNDTANFLKEMDYFYSVDTSVFHLSLLLGVPSILLYKKYLSWIWDLGFYGEIDMICLE